MDTLYIEEDVAGHPRVAAICERFPRARRVPCVHYGEVFNRRAQNFRLQKRRPALILARKRNRLVHRAPPGYAITAGRQFYFSHMLNCLYDCRYCFLQGMHRSAHYVLFVNYEEFQLALEEAMGADGATNAVFYSGYDCDSLALEPLTGFARHFVPFFAERPRAVLELRTKSTQVRELHRMTPAPNCVVAYSFTPEAVSRALEHKVPDLGRRIAAAAELQARGWSIGLRFDPLVYYRGCEQDLRALFAAIFARVRAATLHSVSVGAFRLPRQYFERTAALYPEEPLFAGPLERAGGMVSYQRDIEARLMAACTRMLLEHVPREILRPCAAGEP